MTKKLSAVLVSLLMMICVFTGCSGSGSAAQTDQQIAESYIGSDVNELIADLGEPQSSEYQASCELPDAEDGFLTYEGFTVVTVKTADDETVQRVDAEG